MLKISDVLILISIIKFNKQVGLQYDFACLLGEPEKHVPGRSDGEPPRDSVRA